MTYQEPARLHPATDSDPMEQLFTVSEIDTAIHTLNKLSDAWEAELGDAARREQRRPRQHPCTRRPEHSWPPDPYRPPDSCAP